MKRTLVMMLALTTALSHGPPARAQGWRSFFSGGRARTESRRGKRVYVRLVRADVNGAVQTKSDPALADVLEALRATPWHFSSYRLVAAKRIRVKDGLEVAVASLELRFSDVQGGSFRLEVRQNDRPVIRSRVHLRAGRPVILGGLPADGDGSALLLVLVRDEGREKK